MSSGMTSEAMAESTLAVDGRGDAPARSTRGDSTGRAYEQLRELIVWGQLAPGSRIVENEMAALIGVSRTPIRSALLRLQLEGYVTVVGGETESRLIVAPMTQDDAGELFGMAGELEALAVRTAAGLPGGARRALVKQLRRANGQLASSLRDVPPDPARVLQLDAEFHGIFVAAGAGRRVKEMHRSIRPQAERYLRLYASSMVDELARSVEEHVGIMTAIATGDADAAQIAVERNWRSAAARLRRVIAALGERGHW